MVSNASFGGEGVLVWSRCPAPSPRSFPLALPPSIEEDNDYSERAARLSTLFADKAFLPSGERQESVALSPPTRTADVVYFGTSATSNVDDDTSVIATDTSTSTAHPVSFTERPWFPSVLEEGEQGGASSEFSLSSPFPYEVCSDSCTGTSSQSSYRSFSPLSSIPSSYSRSYQGT